MKKLPSFRQAGFTLTEILVAMVIALIGVVMMFQIMETTETRKRTTGAGSDAQVAGSIAMYAIERDLRGAGNGFGGAGLPAVNTLGCTVNAYDTVRAAAFTFPLLPVQITETAGAPDSITVLYGNADVTAQTLSFTSSPTATTKNLEFGARGGLMQGDLLLIVSGGACNLVELTDNSNVNGVTIDHAQGVYARYYKARKVDSPSDADYEYDAGLEPTGGATARFNAPAGVLSAVGGTIFNLGRRDMARRNIWQISGNSLTVADDLHNGAAITVGDGIIDMQAEYGLSTTTPPTWQSAAPADWSRVVAIRVVLLARSQQYEKENVTTVAPSWTNLNNAAAPYTFTMTNVDGSPDTSPDSPENWRRYRYRVYETVIPVRNAVWGSIP